MKLSKTALGFRFTKKNWEHDRYLDITSVGKFWIRGTDQNGNRKDIEINDMDPDWIMLGETARLKESEI